MTPAQAMTKAIDTTPSLVALDNTEADVIHAARALRHLAPPPGRMGTSEQLLADDLFYTGWQRLMDAIDRLPEEEQ